MPSRIASPIAPPATVVVTGANGFIAQHCIASLLKRGYRVVGTVRSAGKASLVRATHADHSRLEVVIVDDITSPKCYLDALRSSSCAETAPSAVMHLAAPFHYNATDFEREMMVPAVMGSTAVLETAAEMKSVRRVVHTNSFACIFDAAAGLCPGKTYTSHDWSPLTHKDGANAPNAPTAYRASKTVAERAAWRFMETEKPSFDLVSLCPAMVFGPFLPASQPTSLDGLNTSNSLVWSVLSAGATSPVPPTKGPVWVDVRDVAEAHVRALLVPEAGGGRYMVARGVYCNQEIADVSREVVPKLSARIPVGEPGRREDHTHFGVDVEETERVLGIERWRELEECLGELAPQLFDIERQGKGE